MRDSAFSYHGSISSKIVDAWVYMDDNFLGAFELPARIPVLDTGLHKITISPGILKNNIYGTRAIYGAYRPYQTTLNLKPLVVDTAKPYTFYASYYKFMLLEDFELGTTFNKMVTSAADIMYDTTNAFEGKRSLKWELHDSINVFVMRNNQDLAIKKQGRNCYIEMNYRCNNNFSILLDVLTNGVLTTYNFYQVNAQTNPEWKKLYLDLTSAMTEIDVNATVRVRIQSVLTDSTKRVYGEIDNLKLLYADN